MYVGESGEGSRRIEVVGYPTRSDSTAGRLPVGALMFTPSRFERPGPVEDDAMLEIHSLRAEDRGAGFR